MTTENLSLRLLDETTKDRWCSHLRQDNEGPYCDINLKPSEKIIPQRRYVCDTASLQLWCLDKERHNKCIFYNGEKFE